MRWKPEKVPREWRSCQLEKVKNKGCVIEMSLLQTRQLFQFEWTLSWCWIVFKSAIYNFFFMSYHLKTEQSSSIIGYFGLVAFHCSLNKQSLTSTQPEGKAWCQNQGVGQGCQFTLPRAFNVCLTFSRHLMVIACASLVLFTKMTPSMCPSVSARMDNGQNLTEAGSQSWQTWHRLGFLLSVASIWNAPSCLCSKTLWMWHNLCFFMKKNKKPSPDTTQRAKFVPTVGGWPLTLITANEPLILSTLNMLMLKRLWCHLKQKANNKSIC